jgi:Predicted acetyltransferase
MNIDHLLIRDETPDEEDAISELTRVAFATLAVSDHTEQYVISALRASGNLTLSLVALLQDRLVGHIAFSPIRISDGTTDWYGLGPISVLPELQRRGIGKALMHAGLARLKALGGQGCCLVGHPDYYPKFGFIHPDGLSMEGVPAEVFFALSFDGTLPQGQVTFHESFGAQA